MQNPVNSDTQNLIFLRILYLLFFIYLNSIIRKIIWFQEVTSYYKYDFLCEDWKDVVSCKISQFAWNVRAVARILQRKSYDRILRCFGVVEIHSSYRMSVRLTLSIDTKSNVNGIREPTM